MKQFVALLAVAGCGLAAPVADADAQVVPYINQGAASGPLTPAVGDLVATPKGYKSLALEGFSEDLNQDGFVDPIGQAVPVVQYAAPVVQYAAAPAVHQVAAPVVQYAAAPVVHQVAAPAVAAVRTVGVAPASTLAVAPAVYSVPAVHHLGYQVHHQVHHVPQVTVAKQVATHTTHHVINHAPVVAPFAGFLPVAAAPAPAAAPAATDDMAVVEA